MRLREPASLVRLGRHLLWSHPSLYQPFGIIRGRGNCKATDYDVWIEGYPRSANTFAVKSFQAANPGVKVRSHHHIPAFVIQSLRDDKPGMLMVRKPEDAVLSWVVFWKERVANCLDYYLDFHRALLPYLPRLFIAQFEEVTSQFDQVVIRFNQAFGTDYAPLVHNADTVSRCFAEMEQEQIGRRGFVDEMRVPRPSPDRAELKTAARKFLRESPGLAGKLQTANELYRVFASAPVESNAKRFSAST